MSCFVAFHYKSYGTFCLHEKRLIISRVDLPTTEIIEPFLNGMNQAEFKDTSSPD